MERDIEAILRSTSEADAIRLSGLGVTEAPESSTRPENTAAMVDLLRVENWRLRREHDAALAKVNERCILAEAEMLLAQHARDHWKDRAKANGTAFALSLFALGCVIMWAYWQAQHG